MTGSRSSSGVDGPAAGALLTAGRFFTRWEESEDRRVVFRKGGRSGDAFYRDRWSHDKIVRSTHGVNCTGSCSWKVYVKDGVITWESQATDYPSVGPDSPEYEPRGCPRGAAFSWYTYSPTRVRYPYAREVLIEAYRAAKRQHRDPVDAWAAVVGDPTTRRRYQQARGKGGLIRVSWDEALEIAAAAHVHTIRAYGPDRCAGFSPIPAMSMVSHCVGTRFIQLIGGVMTSFYDWYADLPVASPQVFGDQTDVPESGDWWDSTYLMMWGSNVPVTRTPDAHWMTEVRYRGTKVVAVSPDYADNTKFADEWMPAQAGSDAALAMAMGHVMLREFFVDRQTEFFNSYVRQFTDLPFLIRLELRDDGSLAAGKFLTAADLDTRETAPEDTWKTVLLDDATGQPVVPGGSIGHRYAESGEGHWNLDLDGMTPRLSLYGSGDVAEVMLPAFTSPTGEGEVLRRGVPVTTVGDHLVTTVFDLMLAQYGVGRDGLPGEWPTDYTDVAHPYTPAWQAEITGVPAEQCIRIAREFAQNAIDSQGRSMIIMGSGICQWFHGDATYRAVLALLMLTGCQGRNGGGWAHYVGQEKCRPITGWISLANALDWSRPPRTVPGTSYWYMHTGQWRNDGYTADSLLSPLAGDRLRGKHTADTIAQSARLGWMPFYPQFAANPLDVADQAQQAVSSGTANSAAGYVAEELRSGRLQPAIADIDAEQNWPRTLVLWRSNLFGSSAKGDEYFLQNLLGTQANVLGSENPKAPRPIEVAWHDEAPQGKLDLLVSADFRMTSTTLHSDIVFPAATWYEKHDLSSTDMHPFVHAFSPAIDSPWQSRTDFELFHGLARRFSELAEDHLGTRRDLVAVPMQHDTAGETSQPRGEVRDWLTDDSVEAAPGRTMPNFTVVERDYTKIADKLAAVGPLADQLGFTVKAITYDVTEQVDGLKHSNGVMLGGSTDGRPAIDTDAKLAEAILRFSGTTNGALAVQGFRQLERRVGRPMADLAEGSEERRISFADTQTSPQPVITSPEWSGSETGGRRYAPFTQNIERLKPFHTLTGRMHFYLDHDWMADLGEAMPIYRPPLDMHTLFGEPRLGRDGAQVTVRYLTPHSKWSIHSEYQDNLLMLSLSRGGPTVWMSTGDATAIGVEDNEWVECDSANGVFVGRAIVSHRIPDGLVFVHHVQERTIDVPKSERTGRRGGIHNSVTRLLVKPSHLIGGYAQLSYTFNYLGPTGNQRDIVATVRRRSQEVQYR
ncbi:nitrate reductase subunit alpha [Microlunatus soli]|uniref:nitrate reductase (quinone) n=1 Tax=Microlunatus soli TaxID=630515 RepID=A0A1H2ADZ9_9ACTN|nr:nitrate reductase subunit alpha [Microlunatus soli]SDT44160.1 respiratory nitrate reductase alpha subunit apoprotein [Microlunatus soli]